MDEMTARQFFAKLKIGDLFFKNFLNAVKSGDNTVSQNIVTETMVSDDKWINEIENLLFSVEQVVKDPKKSIIDEKVVVQVEKAKKITPESVRHLSSHSNYVRSVDENGDVHPNKILTLYMDEDLLIYENRFVYTLILRLMSFLEQKYNYLKENSGTFDTSKLKMRSDFKYNGLNIEYDLNIRIKKSADTCGLKSSELLSRIETLKQRVKVLTGSSFYHKLSKTRPITPPISKTNIIRMNNDYNNCYRLWLFLSSFVNTGYSVTVSDKALPVEQSYTDDLAYIVAISLKAMMDNLNFGMPAEENYSEQITKEFNIVNSFNYIPTFKNEDDGSPRGDYINQFYYEKIKEILTAAEEEAENSINIKRDFAFPFTNFYRQLSKINNMIFDELLSCKNDFKGGISKLEKKQSDLKFQKELYRRNNLLANLKKIDCRDTQLKNIRLLEKVKKLQFEIDMLKGKTADAEKKAQPKKNPESVLKDIAERDEILSKEILRED